MEREMNFWDLCVALGNAIGRLFIACGRVLARMVRLSYRYWWLVIVVLILAVSAALYYTRKDNITYKVQAVALLNGPSVQQFEQAYAPLKSNKLLPPDALITELVNQHIARQFETFRVIDCLNDGVADKIDFKRKSKATDTVNVQMNDRLCLQFRIKARDLEAIPTIELALLSFLNANPALQQAYAVYLPNLREEVIFHHRQAQKLDSLTSSYYFRGRENFDKMSGGTVVMSDFGDWRVRLFLEEIYKQQQHLQLRDQRYQLATAPITLENHFVVNPKPVNGRMKCVVVLFLLGWIGACVLAEIIDKRKAIFAWLKK